MKNSFRVENDEIVFRRANVNDNLEEIAALIYETDPYIYPFWFNNSLKKAQKFLSKLIIQKGHLYNIDNLYIAYDKTSNHVIGILCAIDKSVPLDFDWTKYKKINHNYKFTIENYVQEIEKEIRETDQKDLLYISNICVSEELRGKRIGSKLIGYFISQMEERRFNTFALDCLLHNLRAKNLYHSMGFKEMKEIVGFDGTDHSDVEVVSFLRKKGAYYPEEFQASYMDKKRKKKRK